MLTALVNLKVLSVPDLPSRVGVGNDKPKGFCKKRLVAALVKARVAKWRWGVDLVKQAVDLFFDVEDKHGLVKSNVELTGAARPYRAASSDRRERG